MQCDAIAGADLAEAFRLDHAFHVGRRDDAGESALLGIGSISALAGIRPWDFVGHGIQHHQTADEAEFTDVFHAQRPHAHHAATGATLVGIPGDAAVVEDRALGSVHADVAGTVELGLDLADFGGDQFVVVHQCVLAEGAAGGRAGDGHLPAARAEGRRFAVVVLADGDGLELLDRGQRALDVGRVLGVVGAAGLVVRAPLRRAPAQGASSIGPFSVWAAAPAKAASTAPAMMETFIAFSFPNYMNIVFSFVPPEAPASPNGSGTPLADGAYDGIRT